ncbi:MAG TPA: peroxiredoxin [Oceanospirillaceae bacterium]|nr:peroxiredoxin [Oceanospirillaceae bacterium]
MPSTLIDENVPSVTLNERLDGENLSHTTAQLCAGQKVVLFAVPAAYTPTCSNKHLPGFEAAYEEFKQLGVDRVICLSVNDAWVMSAWGEFLGIKKVQLLGDGNADFTQALGLQQDLSKAGFGLRSKRYSMFINDGVIEQAFVETKGFEVSDAQTMLDYLQAS